MVTMREATAPHTMSNVKGDSLMVNELTNAAATLIAGLPENFGDLTADDLEAMSGLEQQIVKVLTEHGERTRAMLALAEERGAQGGEAKPLEYLTVAERAQFMMAIGEANDAERAAAALDEWRAVRLAGIPRPGRC
jgi:predicted signal transduction protein with EAL and GGDEF domain